MWHLPKPDLQDTLNDVDAFENLGIITPAENPILKQLVQDYDNGDASLTNLQRAKISDYSGAAEPPVRRSESH